MFKGLGFRDSFPFWGYGVLEGLGFRVLGQDGHLEV